jgi:hypothetical protein
MRLNVGMFNWGVFFVALGAVPLLVTQDILPSDFEWWSLWPLVLVGIGVGLVVQRTLGELIGGLIVSLAFGVMFGGLASLALEGDIGDIGGIGRTCGDERASQSFPAQQGSLTGSAADVTIQIACGEVDVTTAAGAGWALEGTDEDGEAPRVTSSSSSLEIRPRDREGFFAGDVARAVWRVTLPADPTIDLRVNVTGGDGTMSLEGATLETARLDVSAGSGTLDLTGATAERLEVQVNAGSASVTLPASDLTGELTANAGSIEACAPAGAGLRLTAPGNLFGSNDFADQGLIQDGDTWETPGYESAPYQIELTTKANAGSISLNPDGGCK